jgi:dTMP kinase
VTQGLLIALEGIDGAGTTSQAQRLAETLERRGLHVHLTAEPSPGPIGQTIRRVLKGELTMTSRALAICFAADRIDHLDREIVPELDRGAVVVSDRYLLSSFAYQALDNPLDWVVTLNKLARSADLNILLRVSPETAAKRRAVRAGADERFDAHDTQRRIAAAYDRVVALPDIGPAATIDGEQSLAAVEAAITSVVDELIARMTRGGSR